MKKFMILFIAMATTFGCSSDDNNSEEIIVKDLVLSTDKKEVQVGDEVLFTILDKEGKKVDASIYVENALVKNPVKFDKAGDFSVVAKKEGFKNSNSLTIKVKDKEEGLSQLSLKSSSNAVKVGDKVTFTIAVANVVENGATIYNVTTGVALPNNVFEATTVGEFAFVAKKAGFADSTQVVVIVEEAEDKSNNFLTVNGNNVDFRYVILDVMRENVIDKDGNLIEVDKVVKLDDGRFANEYSLMILEQDNYLIITLRVLNSSVVEKDGSIVNYGKRVLPTNAKDVVFTDLFLIGGDYFILENYLTAKKFDLKINNVFIPNDGIGSGVDGVFGIADFGFSFESEENEIDFSFAGDVIFSESLEKESKAFKFKNR